MHKYLKSIRTNKPYERPIPFSEWKAKQFVFWWTEEKKMTKHTGTQHLYINDSNTEQNEYVKLQVQIDFKVKVY